MEKVAKLIIILIDTLGIEFQKVPTPITHQENRSTEFYFSIFFRSLYSFDAAAFLLRNLERKPFWRYSYALIARTIVMDIIIAAEAINAELEGAIEMKRFLDRIYIEHHLAAVNSVKTAKIIYKDNPAFEEIVTALLEKHKTLNLDKEKPISLYQSLRKVHNRYTGDLRMVSTELFEHFDLFSKLSHFGEYSMELMTLQVTDCRSKLGDGTIKRNAELIVLYLVTLMDKLSPESNMGDKIAENYSQLVKMNACT